MAPKQTSANRVIVTTVYGCTRCKQSWSGSVEECAAITTDFSDLSIMIFHRPDSE